jgi:hypothetical protein
MSHTSDQTSSDFNKGFKLMKEITTKHEIHQMMHA